MLSGRGLEVCEMKGSVAEGRQLRTAALVELTVLVHMVLPEVREARTRALKELAGSPHTDRSQKQIFVQEKK